MRDGEKTATGKIIKIANGKNGIGIGLTDHTEIKSPENVKFPNWWCQWAKCWSYVYLGYLRSGVWSRPRAGRKIAGTGLIEKDAGLWAISVGPYLKVKSAADSGADIFFVPNNLASQLRK